MASRYGHAWVSQFGSAPDGIAAAEWRSTLAGLTAARINLGFAADRLRGSEWPPSSSAFAAMCFQIPTFAAVKHELRAVSNPVSRTPFLRQVWSFIDGYLFARVDALKADRLLKEAYDMASEYVMRGGCLPEPVMGAIEQKKPDKSPPPRDELVRAELARMAQILRENNSEGIEE